MNIVLGELMLRHTSDIDTDFIGSRTQRICRCLDNVVICSSVNIFKGCLDNFSFGCLNVGVYLSCSQGFSPHFLLV